MTLKTVFSLVNVNVKKSKKKKKKKEKEASLWSGKPKKMKYLIKSQKKSHKMLIEYRKKLKSRKTLHVYQKI